MESVLEMKNIYQAYGRNLVISDFSLTLDRGQIGCLLGQSGCGKTSVLRTIAGFEKILAGEIILRGKTVARNGLSIPPEKRRIGMVFQDYALFPHLTVFDNVAFGVKTNNKARKLILVSELLEKMDLEHIPERYPHELSGGQQQRVALARALAPRPDLLLMDEPFSNLDVAFRESLSVSVRRILKENGATALMVTHNQNEAFAMADEIGVMHEGKIKQWDTAYNLYHRPNSLIVAEFVGDGVLLPAIVNGNGKIETSLGILSGETVGPAPEGKAVRILIRPEDIVHDDDSPRTAQVVDKAFRGANILYTLLLPDGEKVLALVPSHHKHPIGSRIGIRAEVSDLVLF
ncbi:MAG: ABC transporter ATP-binding protein [bacterium]